MGIPKTWLVTMAKKDGPLARKLLASM